MLSEDESRQILARQVANVDSLFRSDDRLQHESPWSLGKSFFMVAAVGGIGLFLLIRGYPAAVFLWGDEKLARKDETGQNDCYGHCFLRFF